MANKKRPTVEEFAAEMADKEDNPTISYRDADRIEEANKLSLIHI